MIYVRECLPMFSYKSFIVFGLIFRSLIHFEFIFVFGVRTCSSVIFLHVVGQFSQHHLFFFFFPAPLVKEVVFSPLYSFASFVKDKVSVDAWICLWASYFVPLICISVLNTFG